MSITITASSKETVSRLIRNEFHNTPEHYWHNHKRKELIQTAKNFGLDELEKELSELNSQLL